MPYIYLLFAVIFSAMLSIMGVLFNRSTVSDENISALYNLILTVSALLAWMIIYLSDPEFHPKVLIYSLLYGVFYTMALTGLFCALKNGSPSLTSFVKQLSLVGVATWGFVFWDTPFNTLVAIGMILIIIAVFFCFRPDKNEHKTVSLKYLFYALMLFIGNAGCTIVQKYQQIEFNGRYGSQLMVFACACSAAVCLTIYLKGKRTKLNNVKISSFKFAVIAGVSSALLNLFIILLASTSLSPDIIYPSIAVGGVILTIIFSVAFCKEKLSRNRWIGLGAGVIAIAILNL